MLLRLLAIMCVLCIVGTAEAGQYRYPSNLWQGLIAEAVEDGEAGMRAVACVVRNRIAQGKDTGLVGLRRSNLTQFCEAQGMKYEVMAKRIVQNVMENGAPDVTHGATQFESIRYPKPYWAAGMVETVQIKHHKFYKGGI
jgi:spore germination cell wall hydrolase CwlJ-like protein